MPAKHISIAIHQVAHNNISRVINDYRIEQATRALFCRDGPITQIMMSSGCQTKSNFNRAFSRISGMTPSAFRKQRGRDSPTPEQERLPGRGQSREACRTWVEGDESRSSRHGR